jgi:hypothetical protein
MCFELVTHRAAKVSHNYNVGKKFLGIPTSQIKNKQIFP